MCSDPSAEHFNVPAVCEGMLWMGNRSDSRGIDSILHLSSPWRCSNMVPPWDLCLARTTPLPKSQAGAWLCSGEGHHRPVCTAPTELQELLLSLPHTSPICKGSSASVLSTWEQSPRPSQAAAGGFVGVFLQFYTKSFQWLCENQIQLKNQISMIQLKQKRGCIIYSVTWWH